MFILRMPGSIMANNRLLTWQIVEMQYRVVVAYQNAAWEKGNTELTNLFAAVKKEECDRRINLREFLVAFVQRQQRLFLSLPGVHNAVLEELVGKEISLEEVERSVQSAIKSRTEKYNADLAALSPAPSQDGDEEKTEVPQLESPLLSDLLTKAKVIERRVGNGWQTCLAIITADSFLHLFDIDSKSIIPGSSPEVAFKTLVPSVFVPSSANMTSGKTNFSRGWSDSITPSDSMVLANCSVLRKNDTAFELTETTSPTGAQKMFGKIMIKRALINTSTKDEAEDWIAVLTA